MILRAFVNFHVDGHVEVVLRQIVEVVVEVQKCRCDGQCVLVLQKN